MMESCYQTFNDNVTLIIKNVLKNVLLSITIYHLWFYFAASSLRTNRTGLCLLFPSSANAGMCVSFAACRDKGRQEVEVRRVNGWSTCSFLKLFWVMSQLKCAYCKKRENLKPYWIFWWCEHTQDTNMRIYPLTSIPQDVHNAAWHKQLQPANHRALLISMWPHWPHCKLTLHYRVQITVLSHTPRAIPALAPCHQAG